MRKFSAILFLFTFLFNLVGYRAVFNYAQKQSDNQLETSLDKSQYNDADLITIKVPLSMPYQTLQSGWERVNGEVTCNGKVYKYVKRRVVAGEMQLQCLPDNNKMRIQTAKDDFFKTINDIASTNKKSDTNKSSVSKNSLGDYDQHIASFSLSHLLSSYRIITFTGAEKLITSPHTPPIQPPDVA
ncbi:MAG: hypothetical protein M3R72_09190 [Bacteroidota bacterium]|nr:hypothetical protein [Bacteroidota bacterium]